MGGGKVQFYDCKGDGEPPYLANAEDVKDARWLLVVYPERLGVPVLSKQAGLVKVRGGDWLSTICKKRKKAGKKTPAKKKPRPRVAGARPTSIKSPPVKKAQAEKPENKTDGAKEEDESKPSETIFDSLDAAMDSTFPLGRLMTELEGLMTASQPVYSKEGDFVGDVPAFQIRLGALKTCLEYREGRAREREKPQPKAKAVTMAELETMLAGSEEACLALEGLIRKCRVKRLPTVQKPIK